MLYKNGRAFDEAGKEVVTVGEFTVNGQFRVYVKGRFIGDYETEEQAGDVKKAIDKALDLLSH